MKTYRFERDSDGCRIYMSHQCGTSHQLPLDPSLKLRNHSPTRFEWGYEGSGPAQAALAVLLDCLGPEDALSLYQGFKREFISPLPKEGGIITEKEIRQWMRKYRP